MSKAGPIAPFYRIVTDDGHGLFSVEGPMTDDSPPRATPATMSGASRAGRLTGSGRARC